MLYKNPVPGNPLIILTWDGVFNNGGPEETPVEAPATLTIEYV